MRTGRDAYILGDEQRLRVRLVRKLSDGPAARSAVGHRARRRRLRPPRRSRPMTLTIRTRCGAHRPVARDQPGYNLNNPRAFWPPLPLAQPLAAPLHLVESP